MTNFSLSGRGFTNAMINSTGYMYWGARTYLSRTCIGLDTARTSTGDFFIAASTQNKHVIPLTVSSAADPVALTVRIGIGFSTLGLTDGDTLTVASVKNYTLAGGASEYLYFKLNRTGATYKLYYEDDYGTRDLIASISTGTWYRIGVDVYLDKANPWAEGAYLTAVAATRTTVNKVGTLTLSANAKFMAYWDDLIVNQGHDGGTTSLVTINNCPTDGEILYIKKAYVTAGISSGDITKCTVTDGVAAAPPSSDGDYWRTGTFEGNSFGTAKRVNRASGTWTESNWSL